MVKAKLCALLVICIYLLIGCEDISLNTYEKQYDVEMTCYTEATLPVTYQCDEAHCAFGTCYCDYIQSNSNCTIRDRK